MASRALSVNFDDDDVHNFEPLVTQEEIRERIRKALNLSVGLGRRYSVKELSVHAGVPKRCIQAAMTKISDENYRPLNLENLASIAKFLKAPFVSTFLEPCGLGAFELADQQPLPQVFDSCRSPTKLTKEEHIRKAIEHLNAAEAMEA